MLTADAVGGVWQYTLDLARGLVARGVPSVVAVLGPEPDAAQRAAAASIPGLELIATGLPLDWTAAEAGEIRHAQGRLRALAARFGVGGIHLHSPALVGAESWTAPVVAVSHSCVATWWRVVRGGPLPDDFAWRTSMAEEGLAHADAAIAPSAAHADALRQVYGAQVHVVRNGRDPIHLPDVPRRRAAFTAGRLWDEGKGVAALDHAAAGFDAPIRAAGPIAGPNGQMADFPALRLLGALGGPELAAEFASASAYVSTSRYEPFGLAVLEAAQAGLPLVLSDIPTFRELWDGAALFVRPDDAPELQTALRGGRWTNLAIWASVRGRGRANTPPPPWWTARLRSTVRPGRGSDADRLLHPFAGVVLEPRQCAFPARRAARACRARPPGACLRTRRRLEQTEPAG